MTARGHRHPDLASNTVALQPAHQVSLVEDDEIGTEELILVDLFQRVLMIDRGILAALPGQRVGIVGEAPGRHGRAIDDGDHPVHGDARGDRRPIEGLHEGLGQREARSFD